MGRERQLHKARSGLPRIKQHAKPQSSQRSVPRDDLVSQHWNRKETLSQNYRRLGLASKLNARATGGVEPAAAAAGADEAPFATAVRSNLNAKKLVAGQVKVRRDPRTGAIVKVMHQERKRANPLGDLLVDAEGSDEESGAEGERAKKGRRGIVQELEERAAQIAPKRARQQSQREQEWLERLVAKYGDDFERMARDRKLNPMQQTAADIAKRVRKWQASAAPAVAASG